MFLADVHFFAAGAGLLGQRRIDHALVAVGHPNDDRPIDLARRSAGERLGEMAGRARAPSDQQRTRRVLVEPVDELGRPPSSSGRRAGDRVLVVFVPPCVARPGGLLRTKAFGSSKITMSRTNCSSSAVSGWASAWSAIATPCCPAAEPGFPARLRRGRRAPRACPRGATGQSAPTRDEVEADLRQMPLKPAVEADAVVVLADGEGATSITVGRLANARRRVPPNNRRSGAESSGSASPP